MSGNKAAKEFAHGWDCWCNFDIGTNFERPVRSKAEQAGYDAAKKQNEEGFGNRPQAGDREPGWDGGAA